MISSQLYLYLPTIVIFQEILKLLELTIIKYILNHIFVFQALYFFLTYVAQHLVPKILLLYK